MYVYTHIYRHIHTYVLLIGQAPEVICNYMYRHIKSIYLCIYIHTYIQIQHMRLYV